MAEVTTPESASEPTDSWSGISTPEAGPVESPAASEGAADGSVPDEQADEAAAAPGDSADAAPVPDEPKRKGRHGGRQQERIDELTREREDARRLWMAEQAKRADLEARLAALEQRPAATVADPNKPTLQAVMARGGSYDDWVEAVSEYNAEKRLQAYQAQQQQLELQRRTQAVQTTFAERVNAFRADHPDYDDKMLSADEGGRVSVIMQNVIMQEPEGPAIAYYLGSHPEECERIANLADGPAIYALGRIADKLSGKAPTTGQATATQTRVSHAPAPHSPVGEGRAATTAPADLPFGPEYIRQMNAQIRKQKGLA